ncbi:hypothetical protein [Leifsonia sp. 1010]|uniref:hypothetical protein n=1 Tax=Leifsonia sp. 1010 TaxID=2817769 RepID=UPI0028656576|nr:hypothetical protein [Leifsonia sp. 1010]MDR6613533.1 hypothetical protein [Leifsonia sp. 1010]
MTTEADSELAAQPTAKVRWYRRRPPASMPPFARTVWWAGHGQLFLAAAFALLGPVGLALVPNREIAAFVAPPGYLLTAMAAPLACSGLMLRRFSLELAKDSTSLAWRIVELAFVVLLIAALSIAFVWLDMVILILSIFAIIGGVS